MAELLQLSQRFNNDGMRSNQKKKPNISAGLSCPVFTPKRRVAPLANVTHSNITAVSL
jgi:hypothetical protein